MSLLSIYDLHFKLGGKLPVNLTFQFPGKAAYKSIYKSNQ